MNQDLSCWGVDAVRELLKSFDSFLHSDHCVSTSKKEKFGQFIVIASLRKVTCRRECRAHYSVMAAQPVKVREIYVSWKDGIKRFQLISN